MLLSRSPDFLRHLVSDRDSQARRIPLRTAAHASTPTLRRVSQGRLTICHDWSRTVLPARGQLPNYVLDKNSRANSKAQTLLSEGPEKTFLGKLGLPARWVV